MVDPADVVTHLTAELESLRAESSRQSLEAEAALHELGIKLSGVETLLEVERSAGKESIAREELERKKVGELEAALLKEKAAGSRVQEEYGERSKKETELEREKRELVVVYERSEADKSILEDSLTSLRTLYSSLQTSYATLEASLQESSTSSRSSLLRIQTLTSSITSLEADKTFLTTELSRGREEWANSRREKHAELVRVQVELENSEIEERNAKRALEALRDAHAGLTARHGETIKSLASVRDELAASGANFASEMGSMERLVELMRKREEERKVRVEELEQELVDDRTLRQDTEDQLQQELADERDRNDELEGQYEVLRTALDREGQDSSMSSPVGSFALSPAAQLAASSQKSGRSYAEVYGEYVRMQEELAAERKETRRLQGYLTEVLADLAERARPHTATYDRLLTSFSCQAPLLKDQRIEYDRLALEATQIASQLAQAMIDRDRSDRAAESSRLDVDRLERDNAVLGDQLRDLGRQVRSLMRKMALTEYPGIEVRSAGDGDPDEEEQQIQQRAQTSGDTDSVVSAHLVTFQTINQLQEQNQKLLRITREMGARLERGEEEAIERRTGDENAAVAEAHEVILALKDKVISIQAKNEAFVRERDMFRSMLAQAQRGAGAVASTSNGSAPSTSIDVDSSRMLADVQASFDAYRAEIAEDTNRLRMDLETAQHDAGTTRTELAKAKARCELLSERFRLLDESYKLQSGDLRQVTDQGLQLRATVAAQEKASYQLSEEMYTLKSASDQLRHEATNLRSERAVWQTVEKRLNEDNATLNRERSHLTDLMRNLQTMQNDLERSGSEARRRLEEQVTRLESQNADLNTRLNEETDEKRQLVLRKELDSRNFQDRLDRLTSDAQATREGLIVAKTSQEHLEQRVADLVNQITAKDEKLAIYEGRRSASSDSAQTREQELEIMVGDLRAELRAVQASLERATGHVQQYQGIAEAEGDGLRQMTATYDEYKLVTDAAVAEKDAEISSLRERLHSLTTELTTANNQNSDLHRQIETSRADFEKERKSLQDAMHGLRATEHAARDAQQAALADLQQQAQFARDAHDKYEKELVAHADDVKQLIGIKKEIESARGLVGEHRTAAEVATANLAASEESWSRQKQALTREVSELEQRFKDLQAQNAVLHQHLESVGSQSALARQSRPTEGGEGADNVDEIAASHDSSIDQLRDAIRYLRREKDIVDLQLEFSKQEAARLRQQHEFAARNLEETRQALTEERQKSGQSAASSTQHAELLERIHTSKLLRESNQTLRDENEKKAAKVLDLDARLRTALDSLDPLKEQLQILGAEIESKTHNIKLLEEDNERWKNRNQTILAKYERIDPEELRALETEVTAVKASLEEAQAEKAALVEKLDAESKAGEATRASLILSTDRFKALQVAARAGRDTNATLTKELADLTAQHSELKEKIATTVAVVPETAAVNPAAQAEKEQLVAQLATITEQKTQLEARLLQESTSHTASIKLLEDRIVVLEARIVALETEKGELEKAQVEAVAATTKLTEEYAALKKRNDVLFSDNKKGFAAAKASAATIAELTQLKQSFEENNATAIEETVLARLALVVPPPTPSDAAIEETVRERVVVAEAALATERDAAIAAAQATVESLKAQLATAPSQADLDTLRSQLAVAQPQVEALRSQLAAVKAAPPVVAAAAAPVDVDALVKAKLLSQEPQRLAAMQAATAAALAKQAAEHKEALAKALADQETESATKTKVIRAQLTRLQAAAAAAKAQATTAAASAPATPVASTSAAAAAPLPPLVAAPGAASPARAGAPGIRGGAAGRGRGRGSAEASVLPSIRGAARGGAVAARGRGRGMLDALAAANSQPANPSPSPKRSREGDDPAGDLAKRLKGPPGGGV